MKRMGIVGGPTINTAFLKAGLLDEVDILIDPGIDGRAEMPCLQVLKKDCSEEQSPKSLFSC